MERQLDRDSTTDTALVDGLCNVADTLRLVELFCCGCAYVAEREGIHDGTAFHVHGGHRRGRHQEAREVRGCP